jgi:hypothetical protein
MTHKEKRDQEPVIATSDTSTAWEQRRRVVQAIMDSLMSLLDRGADGSGFSLRDILRATDVTLDTIRARVAHQAFAGGPPEAFWPPMKALLDTFAPELGMLVCGELEMDPAYERFWGPETQELKHALEQQTPCLPRTPTRRQHPCRMLPRTKRPS